MCWCDQTKQEKKGRDRRFRAIEVREPWIPQTGEMNALTKLGLNMAQLTNPTVADRVAVAEQIAAMGQAGVTKASAGISASAAATDTTTAREVGGDFDQDMFLRLLMEQMRNQDPLEPMDNADMIAQLAQFTSLEQMNNLNESFETLSQNFNQLNFISAGALLGRYVGGIDAAGGAIEGIVEGVFLENSIVYVVIDGHAVPLGNVVAMGQEP